MRRDIARAGLSLLLMGALALGGLPVWLVLPLPLVAYVGLWLLVAGPEATAPNTLPVRNPGERAAFETCLGLRTRLDVLSGQIQDPGVASRLGAVTACLDKCLDAIAEDETHAAAPPLSELMAFADKLLSAYVKVVRRGFAEPDLHLQIEGRLRTIERACERFWDRLNRDAVVDLRALSETIEVLFEDAGRAQDDGDRTSPLGSTPGGEDGGGRLTASAAAVAAAEGAPSPAPPNGAFPALTPREREILCRLPSGKTDQEIAAEHFISPRTVSKHVESIYGKLGVRNRAEAVAVAVRHGLCDGQGEGPSSGG